MLIPGKDQHQEQESQNLLSSASGQAQFKDIPWNWVIRVQTAFSKAAFWVLVWIIVRQDNLW